MQRRRRERGVVARGLEDRHGPVGALLGLDRLARHEQVARHAHERSGRRRRGRRAARRARPPPARRRPPRGSGGRCRAPSRSRRARPRARARPAAPGAGGPTRGARAPAGATRPAPPRARRPGPTASTVSTSPASTAKCIRLARSGRSSRCSASRTCAFRRRRASAGRLRSIARRASSWRKPRWLRGDLEHPGELGLRERVDAVAEQLGGELEPDPRGHDRELLERLAAVRRRGGRTRARTASTTVAGTASAGEASASVTKNGLPPVTRCRASPSAPVLAASRRTAVRESGGSASRRTGRPARPPSMRWSGCVGPSSSSRKLRTSTAGTGSIRRAT